RNELNEVPVVLEKLPTLVTLNLRGNNIKELPAWIAKPSALNSLVLANNPIGNVPGPVLNGGVESIRDHFRLIAQRGEDLIYEARLLIVGDGAVGKTTLAKKLRDPDYLGQYQDPTTGVDVIPWSFPIEEDKEFKVNIWDFGGQEVNRSIFPFF